MTIDQLRSSDKTFLTPAEVAPTLGSDPQAIRCQVWADVAKLGFPVVIIGRRIKIPRKPFLEYIGEVAT